MVTLVIEHGIADWDVWKPVFDEHAAVRIQHGCIREELFRSADGATILNVMRWPDQASAEAFLGDPSLHEAFSRAGVVGEPRATLWSSVETNELKGD
jgi:quinol monooxygenase YgiN